LEADDQSALRLMAVFLCLQKDEVYLNLVLEYIPETVYKVARHYRFVLPLSILCSVAVFLVCSLYLPICYCCGNKTDTIVYSMLIAEI